jgi:hypothetical protein
MKRAITRTLRCSFICGLLLATLGVAQADDLESGFLNPPRDAQLRAYWWWLNGNVTKSAITHDLEEMKAKGFGGALICDAGGADQRGNAQVPAGPAFFSPAWRELYKYTLKEAERLDLEMSLNIQSGWNLGGPMIKAEDAPKKLVWSETSVPGPVRFEQALPEPQHAPALYRDVLVLAYPAVQSTNAAHRPIQNWEEKALIKGLGWSAPDCSPLRQELPAEPGDADTLSQQVLDVTAKLGQDGVLRWDVPPGEWRILRLGYTLNDHCRVSTSSETWQGYALDPIDGDVFRSYWQQIVEPLIADTGPRAGRTLKYLHTDSWEVEVLNWTPSLRDEFKRRRGYDLLPFLPVLTGRIVDSRPVSNRFLHDFRRTIGDLAIDNHYKLFSEGAHRHGMAIHPESGGPHSVPVDSLQCLGMDDAPMSEFWARSPTHRVADADRFFIKQPASAAHTYGRQFVLGEGFTDIGPHWQETLWDNLKPTFDRAAGEGLNRLVWHAFVCSPAGMGLPGQQYFAGTHFNPNTTWWPVSGPFLSYINRCQFLLQQGLFVADACQYYGDDVPNFTQLKSSDPAKVLPGFDYDVATEEVVLTRMSVRNGRIRLPDGMSYRVLVLPDYTRISLPVLRKLKQLVVDGATIIGPKPVATTGLENYPRCDADVAALADELWAGLDGQSKQQRAFGKGRVIWGLTARQVLLADGIQPDFESTGSPSAAALDYIHRRDGDTDIYFVANPSNNLMDASCAFRVTGQAPELWLPDTGEIRHVAVFEEKDGRTSLPLRLEPYGSAFVVFRSPAKTRIQSVSKNGQPVFAPASARDFAGAVEVLVRNGKLLLQADESGDYELKDARNQLAKVTIPALPAPQTLDGGWILNAPLNALGNSATKPVALDRLKSWTDFDEPKLKYFSGTLEYTREVELSSDHFGKGKRLWLDLGEIHELAEVKLNGSDLGIVWKPPFGVDITAAARPGKNRLTVRVTNFWPNRIIGDQFLPEAERVTRTNIRQLTQKTPLMPSGLLGPVRVLTRAEEQAKF